LAGASQRKCKKFIAQNIENYLQINAVRQEIPREIQKGSIAPEMKTKTNHGKFLTCSSSYAFRRFAVVKMLVASVAATVHQECRVNRKFKGKK
jgi:hypothetical protein